jgi:hypothetical protein
VPEEDSEPKREITFSDSESDVKSAASGDEADVFGSSSEDEAVPQQEKAATPISRPANVELYDSDEEAPQSLPITSSGNLRRKRPAGELEDENEEDEVFSSSKERGSEESAPQTKQRRVIDDEEDGEAEADF